MKQLFPGKTHWGELMNDVGHWAHSTWHWDVALWTGGQGEPWVTAWRAFPYSSLSHLAC